jgi:Fatty acid/phospholipid biosynthesis enzyme
MRIGLDAMGGDFAPKAIVLGAILAQKELSAQDKIVLFGIKSEILAELEVNGAKAENFEIVDCPDVITMHDKPSKAFANKPNSSMAEGFSYLKAKKIDTFASAGSTGAMVVGTMLTVGTLEGIIRPTIVAPLPKATSGKVTLLCDVGVNQDAKPEMIYQFGLLGSIYAKCALGIENPRVGLVNIGEEDEKGNAQCKETMALMKGTNQFNFIGNAEPQEIFKDNFDILACDGFVGNILLKNTEGFAHTMVKMGVKNEYLYRCNYELYGGLPLLGANGIVIIGHGISNEKAIKTMCLQSKTIYLSKINEVIDKALHPNK